MKLGRKWIYSGLSVVFLGGLFVSVPLFTQQGFNPDSVMPRDCSNGKMKCGFVPLKSQEKSTLDLDPAAG